jgi:hypothetical protein
MSFANCRAVTTLGIGLLVAVLAVGSVNADGTAALKDSVAGAVELKVIYLSLSKPRTEMPGQNALARMIGHKEWIKADAGGVIVFHDVPSGKYRLVIVGELYRHKTVSVRVRAGETKRETVRLKPLVVRMEM